jgi:hypothetical protein
MQKDRAGREIPVPELRERARRLAEKLLAKKIQAATWGKAALLKLRAVDAALHSPNRSGLADWVWGVERGTTGWCGREDEVDSSGIAELRVKPG